MWAMRDYPYNCNYLQTGSVNRLEDLVLNGYGDFLLGRVNETEDPDILSFLEVLPQYQVIYNIDCVMTVDDV